MKNFVDYTISKEELNNMSDDDLSGLLMYSDRDRKEYDIAEKIYWWCVEEINRRIEIENGN